MRFLSSKMADLNVRAISEKLVPKLAVSGTVLPPENLHLGRTPGVAFCSLVDGAGEWG